MSDTPFMQLYVGDYFAKTQGLTAEEHGAYLLMLMTMWTRDAYLPLDHAKLARIARVSPRRWPAVWDEIGRFFIIDGDRITQKRLLEEYQKATAKSEIRRASGSLGGKAKALKDKATALANASGLPCHSSEPEETTNVVSKPRKRGARLPADWRLPREWGVWAMDQGLAEAIVRREADKFRDYWHAKSGREAAKLDWLATWRNWVRLALERQPNGGPRGGYDDKLASWGIGDAQPVRVEHGAWDSDPEPAARAADVPGVQSTPEGWEPEDTLSFGDANLGRSGDLLPPLRLVAGGAL